MQHLRIVVVMLFALPYMMVGQDTKMSRALLIPSGNQFGTYIESPAGLLSDQTLFLPSTGGTLLVSPSAGVSNTWLLGGNDVTSAPTLNQIGTTSAHDLQIVAGGATNVRLTLDDGTKTTTVNDGGDLRFDVTGGAFSSGFKAGAQALNLNYTLPITAPTANQVLTATAVAGSDVTLGWQSPSTGAMVIAKSKSANEVVTNSTVLQDDDHLVGIALEASSTYVVQGMLRVSANDDANEVKIAFTYDGTLTGAGMEIMTRQLGRAGFLGENTLGNLAIWNASGTASNLDMDNGEDILVPFSGVIQTNAAGNLKIQWSSVADPGGATTTTLHKGSNIVLFKQ